MTEGHKRLHARQDATLARRRKRPQAICEVLEVRKGDGLQGLTDERAEARCITRVRSLGVGTTSVQPQLEQLLIAAGLLARDPALVNSAWRTQDNGTSHAFRLQELKGVNKKALCYNSV